LCNKSDTSRNTAPSYQYAYRNRQVYEADAAQGGILLVIAGSLGAQGIHFGVPSIGTNLLGGGFAFAVGD